VSASFTVYQHPDAVAFLDRAGQWLMHEEIENNLALSVAELLRAEHPFEEPVFLGTVELEGNLAGCAVLAPPDGLYLTGMPRQAVPKVVEALSKIYDYIGHVVGPAETAQAFADGWVGESGNSFSVGKLRLFVLHEVYPLERPASGALRRAEPDDVACVQDWAKRYAKEVGTNVDLCLFMDRLMNLGALYLWDDGGPRCFVTVSGHTRYGSRISAVYTPHENRSHGYASSAVAAAAQGALDSGKHFCVLYADLDAATPNSIYPKIGFRPVSEHAAIDFD
jgi:predicted GNAT family acetyltransferase